MILQVAVFAYIAISSSVLEGEEGGDWLDDVMLQVFAYFSAVFNVGALVYLKIFVSRPTQKRDQFHSFIHSFIHSLVTLRQIQRRLVFVTLLSVRFLDCRLFIILVCFILLT